MNFFCNREKQNKMCIKVALLIAKPHLIISIMLREQNNNKLQNFSLKKKPSQPVFFHWSWIWSKHYEKMLIDSCFLQCNNCFHFWVFIFLLVLKWRTGLSLNLVRLGDPQVQETALFLVFWIIWCTLQWKMPWSRTEAALGGLKKPCSQRRVCWQ